MVSPVYLYTGPEFGERNDAVRAVKNALKKKYGSLDEYSYYTADTAVADVVTLLQSESLFTASKCVVLSGAETLKKKEDIALLASWLKTASSDASVLILVSDEISVDTKVEKLIPPEHKKIFWEMFENRKSGWLQDFFRKSGYVLEDDAAAAVLELVENNTEALKTECSRFFLCFPAGHTVTVTDVESVLTSSKEESVFTLFDAMSKNGMLPALRYENALVVLQKIMLSRNSSSVMITAGLSSCFRRLALWEALCSGHGSVPDDFTLKINGFASKKAQTQYRNAAGIWKQGNTASILSLLADTDMKIRSGGAALEDTYLSMLLYAIIMKNGSSCAEYEAV